MSAPPSNIESVLVENRVFLPSPAVVQAARISGMAAYNAMCAEADKDFEGFWARLARDNLSWKKPFTQTLDESNAPFYKWFADGELNASYNCLDRHLGTPTENKTAIIFESDDGKVTNVTYKELHAKVSQFASALKGLGIKKGDRVIIYMPMTVEGVVAMQACARIGATHSVVFGGFSAKSLQERIQDAGAVAVVRRGERDTMGACLRVVRRPTDEGGHLVEARSDREIGRGDGDGRWNHVALNQLSLSVAVRMLVCRVVWVVSEGGHNERLPLVDAEA